MKLYNQDIDNLKEKIIELTIIFNNLSNKTAKEKRILEKNTIEYKNQYSKDIEDIIALRNNALEVFDKCNEILQK